MKIKKFIGLSVCGFWFLGVWFLGSVVFGFLVFVFLVSRFSVYWFLVSWLQSFLVSDIQKNVSVFERYLIHITNFHFHAF